MDQDNALQTEVQRDVAVNVVQNDVNLENVVENVVAGNVEKEVRTTSVPMFPVFECSARSSTSSQISHCWPLNYN